MLEINASHFAPAKGLRMSTTGIMGRCLAAVSRTTKRLADSESRGRSSAAAEERPWRRAEFTRYQARRVRHEHERDACAEKEARALETWFRYLGT